jgi:tRNA(fMet)-specific endonuclease VapC
VRYLLDTDTCIEVLRRREPASSRVRERSPDDLAVSAMTVAELRFGALNSGDPKRSLAAVQAFLSAPIDIIPFDEDAAEQHASVRFALRSKPIGERDLVIAATARAGNLTIVTHNRRHFERVPDLSVEDWSVVRIPRAGT